MRSPSLSDDAFLQLVGLAYAAAEEPLLWESFLLTLAARVNGTRAVLFCDDPATCASIDVAVCIRRGDRGEFALQHDPTLPLTAVLDQGRSATSVLAVFRDQRDAPFGADERRILAAVAPHVERALQIHQRITKAQREHGTAIEALDTAPCAVFLVNAEGSVLVANRPGRAMLSDNNGLSTNRAQLVASNQRDTKRLRDLCAKVAASSRGDTPYAGGMIALNERRSDGPALQVMVVPAPSVEPPGSRDPAVAAVVFVSDPSDVRGPSEALLRESYGLTGAESDVAARIVVGWSLAEIAAARGSALETVRRQNKQILAKTGARHRSELVRLLATTVLTDRAGKPRPRF